MIAPGGVGRARQIEAKLFPLRRSLRYSYPCSSPQTRLSESKRGSFTLTRRARLLSAINHNSLTLSLSHGRSPGPPVRGVGFRVLILGASCSFTSAWVRWLWRMSVIPSFDMVLFPISFPKTPRIYRSKLSTHKHTP